MRCETQRKIGAGDCSSYARCPKHMHCQDKVENRLMINVRSCPVNIEILWRSLLSKKGIFQKAWIYMALNAKTGRMAKWLFLIFSPRSKDSIGFFSSMTIL
jgi:hypothetical protein